MALDVVTFPDPVVSLIDFLKSNLPYPTPGVSAELPAEYTRHILVWASSDDLELVIRRTRYVIECRDKSGDLAASQLGQTVAAYISAWARSGLKRSPTNYQLISLVDSFPDEGVPRSVVTCEVLFHAN